MNRDKIYQEILNYALNKASRAASVYDEKHDKDSNWTVGWGDVYITGDSGFAEWYRSLHKTKDDKVAIKPNGGGYKYDCSLLWAETVQQALLEFGVETCNDIHLD